MVETVTSGGQPNQKPFWKKLLVFLGWLIVIIYFLFCALYLAARYLLASYIEDNATLIENKVSEQIGLPVKVDSLKAGWDGLNPYIIFSGISVGDPDKRPIKIKSVDASLSFESLIKFSPIFDYIIIDEPIVQMERIGNLKFSFLGKEFDFLKAPASADASLLDSKSLYLLLNQKHIQVNNGTFTVSNKENGKVLRLLDVSAAYEGGALEKEAALKFTPPEEIGSPIDIRADITSLIPYPFGKLADWNCQLFIASKGLDFGAASKWLPDFSLKYKGVGTGDLWLNLKEWSPVSGTFIGALSDVMLQLDSSLKPLNFSYIKGKINADFSNNTYNLTTKDFSFKLSSGKTSPVLDLDIHLSKNQQGSLDSGSVKANEFEFTAITDLLPSLPVPQSFKEFIAERRLSGHLEDVVLSWNGSPSNPTSYTGSLKFFNITSLGNSGKNGEAWLPGFKNITGSVDMTPEMATVKINSADAGVAFPGVFPAAAFSFNKLAGEVVWTQKEKLEVLVKSLFLSNADAQVEAQGVYRQDDSKFGYLDVDVDIARGNAPAVWKYIPLVAGHDTIQWLKYGLLAGTATGKGKIKGSLENFPFQDSKAEVFDISLAVKDVSIDFYPNKFNDPNTSYRKGDPWPVVDHIGGEVVFHGDSMRVKVTEGSYKDISVNVANVDIPSFSAQTVWLNVDAQASGPLNTFMEYAVSSPVNDYTDKLLEHSTGNGNSSLQLKLDIPLDGPGDVAVNGAFTMKDCSFNLKQFSVPDLSNVKTTVEFSDKGASAKSLTALTFGEPVNASFSVDENGSVKVAANGTIPASALPQILPVGGMENFIKKYFRGKAPFTVEVLSSASELSINAKSSLVGLQSLLPSPLRKGTASANPLQLTIKSKGKETVVDFVAEKLLSGDLVIRNGKIEQASFGNVSLPTLPSRGYAISINTPELSTKEWTAVIDSLPASRGGSTTEIPEISSARIDIGNLYMDNFDQKNFHLDGRTVDNVLQVQISSDSLKAGLEWDKGGKNRESLLTATFSKLYIPSSAETIAEKSKPIEIKGGWPGINLAIDDLTYGDMRLGKVELRARNTIAAKGHLWQIQRLVVSNPDAKLTASGSWQKGFDGSNRTQLIFDDNISNLGGLLDRLAIHKLIRNGNGHLKGQLSWDGTPLGFNTESFDGNVSLSFNKGEILKIDPGAGAKLLSLLTLQSLTRFLTLDFRDFYSKGFAFDTIQGDSSIEDGLMKLKELTIVGAGATVVTKGDINIRKETQDLSVLVLPDVNSLGASIALTIANPIAGIGSFLAQLVLKDPLSKLFSFEYHVTGTWSDPVVTKVQKNQPAN